MVQRPMLLAFTLAAVVTAAPSAPSLAAAQQQADDFDFTGALKTLDEVLAKVGNDRPTTLGIYELQGIVWANLNKAPRARASFRVLLTLAPDHALSGDHPPRVRTPFYEAKGLVDREGALTITRAAPERQKDQVVGIAAQLTRDALKLVRGVRIHSTVGANEKVTLVVPDATGRVALATTGDEVRWWAEVLGDREAVLLVGARPDAPWVDRGTDPSPVVAATPAEAPVAAVAAPAPAPSRGWLRPVGIGVLAAGLGVVGVGAYFGQTSSAARASIKDAARDGTGAIKGLTQVQAAEADRRARESAQIANACFGAGAGVAALGAVLVAVGWVSADAAVVVPTGTGAAVQGVW